MNKTTDAVITEPQSFAMLALKGALKLESLGMKRSGPSALSVVKKVYGIKAKTAKEALPLYISLLTEKGILCHSVSNPSIS